VANALGATLIDHRRFNYYDFGGIRDAKPCQSSSWSRGANGKLKQKCFLSDIFVCP